MADRIELITMFIEQYEDGGFDIGQYLSDLYDDDYLDFEGVWTCDQLIKCGEDEDGIAFLDCRRDYAAEERFLKKHLDGEYQKYGEKPIFGSMTHMQYRSKCGLFEVWVGLSHSYGLWDDLAVHVLPHGMKARELDNHMRRFYPFWDTVLDTFAIESGFSVIHIHSAYGEEVSAAKLGKLEQFKIDDDDCIIGLPSGSVSIAEQENFGYWLNDNAGGEWSMIGERRALEEEVFFVEDEADLTLAKVTFGGKLKAH